MIAFYFSGFEWKIFGLELSVSLKGEEYQAPYGSKWPSTLKAYSPPELKVNPSGPPTQNQDLWGLGCIIWEVFNGPLGQPADLGKLGKVPAKLAPVYKVSPEHKTPLFEFEVHLSHTHMTQSMMQLPPKMCKFHDCTQKYIGTEIL